MIATDRGRVGAAAGQCCGDYREIWLALIAILAITSIYAIVLSADEGSAASLANCLGTASAWWVSS